MKLLSINKFVLFGVLLLFQSWHSYGSDSIHERIIRLNSFLPSEFAQLNRYQVKFRSNKTVDVCADNIFEQIKFSENDLLVFDFNEKSLKSCPSFFEVDSFSKSILKSYIIFSLKKSKVYKKPTFLNAFHFKRSFFDFKKTNVKINDEFNDPKLIDTVATNLIYYIFDQEYACRKPYLAKFISREFGLKLSLNCQKNYSVIVNSTQNQLIKDIDPSRVYRIDYLLADKGSEVVSSFGHSMFRLVICAPKRVDPFSDEEIPETPLSEACLKDQLHHLVVSFRAEIRDFKMDYIKGVFGGYPSKMFLLPLAQVQEEYTKKELRNLKFFPLKLNRQELSDFIDRIVEEKYNYEGAYKFFTKNCATESFDLTKSIINVPKIQEAFALTPFGVLNDLSSVVVEDSQSTMNSYSSIYLNAIKDNFKYKIKIVNQSTLKQFFISEEFRSRKEKIYSISNDFLKRNISKAVFKKRMSAMYMIEELYLNTSMEDLKKRLLQDKKERSDIAELIDLTLLNLPEVMIEDNGYGVPKKQNIFYVKNVDSIREDKNNLNLKIMNQIEQGSSTKFSSEIQKINESRLIMQTIKESIFKI